MVAQVLQLGSEATCPVKGPPPINGIHTPGGSELTYAAAGRSKLLFQQGRARGDQVVDQRGDCGLTNHRIVGADLFPCSPLFLHTITERSTRRSVLR